MKDAKRRVKRETHAGVTGFDVGSDKIWSTSAFGISKKFDQLTCRSESKFELYNRISCNEIKCFKYVVCDRNGFT